MFPGDEAQQWAGLLRQIRDALEPGPLDWLSGLVLPLFTALATIGVALLAISVARRGNALADRSNELVERAHHEQMAADARRRRIPFARLLTEATSMDAAHHILGLKVVPGYSTEAYVQARADADDGVCCTYR